MEREEALQIVEPLSKLRVRTIDHSPNTRIVVTPEMVTLRPGGGARTLELTEAGVLGMAKYAGISEDLGKQLSPATFSRVATELLERKRHYSLILNEGRVVGFSKPRDYRDMSVERVLATVDRAAKNSEIHQVLVLPNYVISLDLIGAQERAVVPGDLVRAGANVTFSPIGTVLPTVNSFVLRLQCTNGATTTDVLREFHYGGDGGGSVWPWFNDSVREAYHSLGPIIGRWKRLARERIPAGQRAAVLEALLRKAKITGEIAEAVRAQALEQPIETSYDAMNLITYASSHFLTNPSDVVRARTVADSFAHEERHQRICPVCHHAS